MTGVPGTGKQRRTRQYLQMALGLSVSLLFLWLAFRNVDFDEVLRHAISASPAILALVLVTKTGALLSASARSSLILRRLNPYSFWRVLKSLLVGFVGNAVFPLRAGEVMRVGYLVRHGDGAVPPTSAVAVLVVERLMDTLFLFLVLIGVLLVGVVELEIGTLLPVMGGLAVASMVALFLLGRSPGRSAALFSHSPFLSQKVERFANGLAVLSGPREIAMVGAATAGYWAFQALTVTVWFWAFRLELAWYAPLVVFLFIAFGAALPSSSGSVGTYHFFAISGMTLLGVGRSEAASVATVGHFLAIVPLSTFGILVLAGEFLRRPKSRREPEGAHLSVHYQKKALPLSWTRRVLRRQQACIYERYATAFPPNEDERVLDLGVNGSLERPEQYFFEYSYPYKSRIVGAGLEDPTHFERCYPETKYVKLRRGEPLPFEDGEFDVVFCNAVIEHVGDRTAQHRFLEEVLRVGRRAFVTTPNRWYPIDLHTVTPLLHWLPAVVYRPIYRALGFEFFSREENLNLLEGRSLRKLVDGHDGVEISRHWFLGFPSNLILVVRR
jgi:uncharacterized protein (TIRG00374 family)